MRYFLRYPRPGDETPPWTEVTKEEFVAAERAAGFHNTMGQPDEPGTGGFGSSSDNTGRRVQGRMEYEQSPAEELGRGAG